MSDPAGYQGFLEQTDTLEDLATTISEYPSTLQKLLRDIDAVLKEPATSTIGFKTVNAALDPSSSNPDYSFEEPKNFEIKFQDGIREFKDKTVPSWAHTIKRSPTDINTDSGWFRAYFGTEEEPAKELYSGQLEYLSVGLPSENQL